MQTDSTTHVLTLFCHILGWKADDGAPSETLFKGWHGPGTQGSLAFCCRLLAYMCLRGDRAAMERGTRRREYPWEFLRTFCDVATSFFETGTIFTQFWLEEFRRLFPIQNTQSWGLHTHICTVSTSMFVSPLTEAATDMRPLSWSHYCSHFFWTTVAIRVAVWKWLAYRYKSVFPSRKISFKCCNFMWTWI